MNALPARPARSDSLLGMAIFGFVLGALALLVTGGIGAKLWAWFVVPIFGLPHLGWSDAAGLALIVSVLWPRPIEDPDRKPTYGSLATRFLTGVLLETTLLGFGLLLTVIR